MSGFFLDIYGLQSIYVRNKDIITLSGCKYLVLLSNNCLPLFIENAIVFMYISFVYRKRNSVYVYIIKICHLCKYFFKKNEFFLILYILYLFWRRPCLLFWFVPSCSLVSRQKKIRLLFVLFFFNKSICMQTNASICPIYV